MSINGSKSGKGSFLKRLELLEQAIKFRGPRQIVITAHDDAEAAETIAAIHPPVTDADLVIGLRQFSRAETIDTSDTVTPSEPDAA
jgi:hypothetical protein